MQENLTLLDVNNKGAEQPADKSYNEYWLTIDEPALKSTVLILLKICWKWW